MCILDTSKECSRHKIAENFCWMMGTFIDTRIMNQTVGTKIISHGVGSVHPSINQEHKRNQRYYQWVAPFLLLQALIFLLPHLFWKKMEGGIVSFLCTGSGNIRTFEEHVLLYLII